MNANSAYHDTKSTPDDSPLNCRSVTISRSEYDELKAARFAIDVLGQTIGRYGVNDEVAKLLLLQFGYRYTEESDA